MAAGQKDGVTKLAPKETEQLMVMRDSKGKRRKRAKKPTDANKVAAFGKQPTRETEADQAGGVKIGGKITAKQLAKDQLQARIKRAATDHWGQSKLQEQSLKVHGDPLDTPAKPKKVK
jgi:hypothetical protein